MPKYIDVEANAYNYGTLYDWFISSVGPEPPVWTEGHIEELEDFYVIPKSTPAADVVEVVRCRECKHLCVHSGALGIYQCALHGDYPSGEYFCADGELKDGGQDDG